tara:strand:+ start:590 stop:1321 length:732 start_codon:yes stop_codon:yes gene_type:complete
MRKIPFYVFKLDGVYRLASSMMTVISRYTIEDADFNKLSAQSAIYVNQLEKAMLKSTTKVHTNKIYELDQIFDEAFKAFKTFVQANLYMPDAAKKEAALILWEIIKKHGSSLNHFGYTKQISRAQNLLAEINRDPRNSAAVTSLAAEPIVANMQDKLDKLIVGIEERTSFTAALPTDLSEDVEKLLITNLKNLCAYIQVKSLLSDVEDWKLLERDLDVLIDEDTRIARLSHTRAASETTVEQD